MNDGDKTFLALLLVGVDWSAGSRRALEWAAPVAATTGAHVLAVDVLTYNHEFLRDITPDTMRTWRRELQHDLQTGWVEPLAVRHGAIVPSVLRRLTGPAS